MMCLEKYLLLQDMLDIEPFLDCLSTTHFLDYRVFYHNNQGVIEQKIYNVLVMLLMFPSADQFLTNFNFLLDIFMEIEMLI